MTFNLTVDLKAKKLALRSRHRFTGRPWPLFFPDLFGVVAPNCSSAGNLVVSGPWACPSVGRGPSKPRCCRTAGSEEVSSEHQAVWGEGEVHRRIGRLPRRHVATERKALREEDPITARVSQDHCLFNDERSQFGVGAPIRVALPPGTLPLEAPT
jgi:hypothetical protein